MRWHTTANLKDRFLIKKCSNQRANECKRIFAKRRVQYAFNMRSTCHLIVWLATRQIGTHFLHLQRIHKWSLTTWFCSFCNVPLCRAAGASIRNTPWGTHHFYSFYANYSGGPSFVHHLLSYLSIMHLFIKSLIIIFYLNILSLVNFQ